MTELRLSGMSKDAAMLVKVAIGIGWTAKQLAGGGIVLHPPVPADCPPIRLAGNKRTPANISALRSKVLKYGDQMKLATATAYGRGMDLTGEFDAHEFAAIVEAEDVLVVPDPPQEQAVTTPNDLPKPPAKNLEVHRRPWRARKSPGKDGGKMYDSDAVVEVLYNGVVHHYECAFPRCGYSHENARSVAAHYAARHSRGKGREPQPPAKYIDPEYTEPVTHRSYRPSERLVEALIAFLEMDINGSQDRREVAVSALTWMKERPDLPEPEQVERRERTAEEVVEAIRMLVSGHLVAEAEEWRRQAAEALETAAEALAEVERLTAERQALRDLLS